MQKLSAPAEVTPTDPAGGDEGDQNQILTFPSELLIEIVSFTLLAVIPPSSELPPIQQQISNSQAVILQKTIPLNCQHLRLTVHNKYLKHNSK
jgi:hypothetical protein